MISNMHLTASRSLPTTQYIVLGFRRTVTLLLMALIAACATPTSTDDSLYYSLGKKAGIQAITDEFLFSLADNSQVLPLFQNTDIKRFREQLATQLCSVAGGPCVYSGDSMTATHRGMHIDRARFNSVVDDLIAAMERLEIPTSAQNALIERLAKFYPEIVKR